jgi:hypothetical protein
MLWLKQKRRNRKVSGKRAAVVINIVAAAVLIAGNETSRRLAKISDTTFIEGLRFFNASFLY